MFELATLDLITPARAARAALFRDYFAKKMDLRIVPHDGSSTSIPARIFINPGVPIKEPTRNIKDVLYEIRDIAILLESYCADISCSQDHGAVTRGMHLQLGNFRDNLLASLVVVAREPDDAGDVLIEGWTLGCWEGLN